MHIETAAGSKEPARPIPYDTERHASPGLPAGVWRDAFLEIVFEAFAGQISLTAEKVLRAYVRCTRPADWSAPGQGPVAFAKQLTVAERACVCRRTVWRAELELERLGLIERGALANGHRKAPRGEGIEEGLGAIGIGFAPMIARYDEIVAESKQAAARRDRLEGLRRATSCLRFAVRRLLRTLPADDPRVASRRLLFEALPTRIARIASVGELEAVLDALRALYTELIAVKNDLAKVAASAQAPKVAVDPQDVDPAVEISGDVSHEVVSVVTQHSDTTTNTPSVSHNAIEDGRTPADAGMAIEQEQEAAGNSVKPENPRQRQRKAPLRDPIAADWSAAQLYDAASDEFRAYLDLERRPAGPLRPADFVEAAWTMANTLGINQHAWAEACQVLGPFAAALAVLVLDRNREHPTHPVRRPGGALRGMTAKARSGDLDLDASLFALLRRSRCPSAALDRMH